MNADEFRLRAESGEIPTVDPKLQTAARSGNRYAQREMERQMAAQQADAERQATIQARQAEMQAKQAARQAERDAAELQARDVRAAAAQGQKVVTDIETGKRSIATHPDGAPVYKTGPVGPQQITSIQPAGPTPDGGNIAPVTEVKQTYRNDRGDTVTSPVEQKTDPKTGETYVERKDAYGRPQRVTTGVDPAAQQKLQLEQESAKLDIHGNNLRAQRMQIEPRIKAVTDEWKAAETEWNKPPKFIQQDGEWVDPSNGRHADPQQVSDWQKSQVGAEARYRSAKRRYEQEAPALKNLDEQEKQLALRKLQIDTQRTALEHGLPAEDGSTAETLTRQQTGQTNPAHDEVMRDLALVPGMGSVIDLANNDQNWKPSADTTTPDVAAPTERPLMPTDDEGKRALFITAFPGLRHPDQYTVGKTDQVDAGGRNVEWTWLRRNGENIASLEADKDQSPVIVMNQNLVQQGGLRDTIAIGGTTGIPVYLADNGKPKDQAAEAQYVASIFTTLRDDPAMQDQTAATARLKELGADPAGIMRAVNSGNMSVQRGEALMKNLYGGTLQASNPEDPATMQRWLQETKTRADKTLQDKYGDPRLIDPNSAGRQWESATSGLGTSATTQNQIHQDFLRDNYLENRGKPGVSRAKYLALHQQDLADNMTLGQNVLSKLHAIGKSTRDDVLGSMIGLAGGATLSLGQAEAAILGDKRAAEQFKADMRLRNRDFASWANSAARNIKAWTTPTGIRTAGAFDQALSTLQRAIDADEQASTPETQAAVTAAEQSARQAALAMHNLAPDESWPTTSDDLDPAKDTALASALNGYRTTADPRFFALYRDRMLMGNGRRQYSSELERKIGPATGGFFSSMDHAMYAGWQEAASEVAADTIAIASGFASKAVQAGLKGMGMTARATRLGKFSAAIAKGLSTIDEIGLAKNSLQRPLTRLQTGRNIAVQGIKGAIGEGTEEIMTEVGSESPNLLQAFGSGMLGVVGLSPAMIVSHFVGSTDMPQREMDQRNAKWANRYNATMAGTVGFQPITAADANVARTFVDPKAHQTLVDALTTQLEQITSAPDPATEQEAAARQQQRAAIEQTLQQIATHTENAVTAAKQVAEIADPGERSFYSGLAKVATGNHALLTTAERKAIQGRKTASGADYFAPVTMPDGQTIETITPEARAETLMNMPAIGRLIQTTESDALVAQQLGVPNTAPAADTPVQEGPNAIRLPATPEQKQQAATVVQTVMQRLQAEYPQLAARTSIAAADPQKVSGGVVAIPNADGTSSIGIIQEDIEHSLANGETPESMIEKTIDNIVLHETLHTLQFQIAGNNAESFYTDLYTQMTPEMLANGRELYGAANWDTLKEWQRAAEVVRMLAEAKIAGRTTDVHRLTAGAPADLLARIAEVIKAMVEAITTGTVPDSVKQHVDALTELYQELLNAPANDNTSTADPADSQQQPSPGETGDGNRQTAEADSNGPAPIDGGTEPAPSPDAGAPGFQYPAPFQYPSPELTAARKVTTEAFRRAIETKPILKKDPDLMREVSDVAFTLADQIAGMSPAEQKRAAEAAINSFLLSPDIATRVSELYAEEKAKAQAYREAARARLRAEARRIITQKLEAINHLISNVGRITRPPNALSMIAAGETLPEEYKAALRVSEFTGGGKNAVVREIINMIWATDDQSGSSPDSAAKGMEMRSGKYANLTADDMWQIFQKEIRGYLAGTESANDIYDPDAELTDDQVDAALAKMEADQTVEKWRELTGRQNLMRGEAMRLEEAYQRIVRDELGGVEPDDFTADDIYARVIEEAKQAQKPAAQPQSTPNAIQQTPAQKAPLNSRVAELSSPMDGGLISSDAVLDTKPLQTAQNHLPDLTRVRRSPLVERAVALAERIIPFFQGNKLKMTAPVVSAAEQYWTKEQREAITTVYDLFGGGGAWGLTLAESLFPNVRRIHINEFDETRAIKIRAQIEYGDKFAEIASSSEVRHAIASIIAAHRLRPAVQRKIERARAESMQQNFIGEQQLTPEEIAEENEAWSWGVINKTAAQYAKSLDSAKQDRVVAILKTMADDPERSGPWFKADPEAEPTVDEIVQWFQSRHAPKAASIKAAADRINQRAGQNVFQFTHGDAYGMDIENGPGVMVIADPPYFATTGYDEVNQKQVVGTNYYQRSAKLMADLVANDNHVIYTDEAWWLRDKIDNAIRPADLVTGQKLAAQIANTLDFTVVAEQIDSRYETLGLHNPIGSPVAASRSASGSRDLRGNDQGTGDGGGNQRGGGTAAVEVPAGTDGQAGIQPSGDGTTETGSALNDRLASAPTTPRIRRSIGELESLAQSQEGFRFWFQDFRGFLENFLGPNKEYAPLVSEFLNATSAASTVGSNVAAMMKALREFIETGTFVSSFLPAHRGNLDRAESGQTLSGPKISEYSDAVFGIETAVPVDRHIAQLLFNTDKPTTAQIAAAKARVAKVGLRLGWTPRQTMAALWAANIARNGRTPQSYERYLQKHRYEIKRLLTADREGNQRGLKASRRIAQRIEQRRSAEGVADGRAAGARLASAPSEQSKSIALLERHPKFTITETSLDKRGLEERMRSRMQLRVGNPKNYVLRVVPTEELKPTQTGEDYENDSSRETARWIRETPASANMEDKRWQDLLPVVADAKGNLDDGNHRHYAATANGDSVMLAMVPKKSKLASYPAYQQNRLASAATANPAAQYRYLLAKQEKAGLTPAEQEALLRAEREMGQSFAFDMDRRKLSAPRGSVTPRFQPSLQLERQTATPPEQQLSLFSAPTAFYSALERTVEAKIPNRTTPEQLLATIKSAGVKEEEIKWSGIVPWLQANSVDGKVSKDAVLEYLRNEGRVQFTEHATGQHEDPRDVEILRQAEWFVQRNPEDHTHIAFYDSNTSELGSADELQRWARDGDVPQEVADAAVRIEQAAQGRNGPRYSQYVLPGGENYREVVLAMPVSPMNETTSGWKIIADAYNSGKFALRNPNGAVIETNMTQEQARKRLSVYGDVVRKDVYKSSHFPDVPNYVAHMRTNERTDTDGKPGLFVEEFQSDRHQQARKQGYKGDPSVAKHTVAPDPAHEGIWIVRNPSGAAVNFGASQEEAQRWADALDKEQLGAIPDAPFRTTWPLALFKRALRDAVASGKEWIGWTVGETQNDRYKLSKQVSQVEWAGYMDARTRKPTGEKSVFLNFVDNSGTLRITSDQDGKIIKSSGTGTGNSMVNRLLGKGLDDAVGKPMADKILSEDTGNLRGDALDIGGSGMKGFYDNMLPKEIGKYVKQWGAKVEKSQTGAQTISSEDIAQKVEQIAENAQGEMDDALAEALTESAARIAGALYSGDSYAEAMNAERQYGDPDAAGYVSNILAGQGIHETNNTQKVNTPIWRINITPEMRKGVQQGQALFSAPTRVTPEQDAQYMDAVNRGDMETAQRMVDETAKESMPESRARRTGAAETWLPYEHEPKNPLFKLYHGGAKGITEFSKTSERPESAYKKGNLNSQGIWMTKSRGKEGEIAEIMPSSDAATYAANHADGGQIYALFADIRNPKMMAHRDTIYTTAKELRDQGYDGVYLIDSGFWIALNPSQVKSADPVTYDANGTVIPLSQRFNPTSDSILYSPAPATQQAVEAALKNLPPLYREVFQASIADPKLTPEDLGRRFGIPARGAENIINQIRTRIRGNVEASTGDLAPKGNSGRPDLGYSTVPSLQRIDQIRAQEGLPLQQTTEEIRGQAEAFLRNPGSTRSLIDSTEDWTAVQTAAANIELVNRALQGRNDIETAELAAAYREQGSRWSETGRARQDVHRSPAERHAMILADLLSTPDASTVSGLKKAKTKADRDAILAGWVARVKGIKEHLLGRGIDLDEALQRLNRQIADAKAAESEASASHQQLVTALQQQLDEARINLKQAEQAAQDATDSAMKAKAEAEAARAAQRVTEAEQATQQAHELDPANTIRLELRKLSIQHRAVVESMRDGATWEQAAATTGLTVEECRRVMQGFIGALRQAAIKTLTLAEDMLLGNTLASPALSAPAPENRQQRLGRMADAMIGAMGYDMGAFDKRSNPATAKTGKAKRATEAKQAKPEPAMMSDEEFSRRQNNPDTHKVVGQPTPWTPEETLRGAYQFEQVISLRRDRMTFEEWLKKPRAKALLERQQRMFELPVSTTTGTLDMHDVKSVAAVRRELHASRAGLFDKVLEFWRQSILSGPQTAIVNTGSNIANSLYHLGPRRLIEAGVNDVLGILGQGNKDAATLGEIAAMTRHIHAALARAGRNMVMAWNNETRIAEYQFLALAQQTDFAGMKEDYIPPAIGGKFGTLMRSISFRHMTAADEFIKAFHGHLEAAAQAHRIAKQEGLSGAAYEARLAALMQEGSEAWSRALAVAEDVTFQRKLNTKDPRAIAVLDKIASATKRASTRYKALSFFFPFVNTPTNIFKTAIEMSPVGGLLAVIDGARALKIRVARGNMTKEQARIAASELYDSARFVQDTTNQLIAAAVFWALSGLVDSGDDDESGLPRITGTTDWKSTRKGERDNQYRTMPPQSIRLGNGTIVSYSRIEPFATVLAGVVDLIHEMNVAGGLNEKALSAYMGRIQNQLDDKTFLAGVSDLINAYHDPERFSAKLAGNIVTGFVPNLIRQPIREADPYVRDTKPREEDGFFTAIGKQVGYTLAPGYAPPMLDVWGNPVTRHQGIQIGGPQTDILIRVFDPSNMSIGKQIDPVDRYIFNWNRATDVKNHLALEPIRDSLQVTIAGKPVKIPLTADEQASANRAAGQAARRFLGDQWDWKAPTQEGIDRIKEIVQRFQNIERDKLRARKLREMK